MCLCNHIQHYGVHTPTQMLIPDPGCPKGGKITAGYSYRGLGGCWNHFKISILVSLHGSDWFDLAAAMKG